MWNKIMSQLFQPLSISVWNSFAWNYFKINSEAYCSSWIFSNVFNNFEIISVFYFTCNHCQWLRENFKIIHFTCNHGIRNTPDLHGSHYFISTKFKDLFTTLAYCSGVFHPGYFQRQITFVFANHMVFFRKKNNSQSTNNYKNTQFCKTESINYVLAKSTDLWITEVKCSCKQCNIQSHWNRSCFRFTHTENSKTFVYIYLRFLPLSWTQTI